MIDAGISPDIMAAKAKDAELVQFKVRMDGLKKRLSNGPSEEEELRKACRDFEAVFVGKLWEQMQKTVPQEGYLHSKQEKMYTSMFNREFSEHLADAGGIGLADIIYEQLADRLKQTSDETLSAGIRPLAENGMLPVKTLEEANPVAAPLRGPEPAAPKDIEPTRIGTAADFVNASEADKPAETAAEPAGGQIAEQTDTAGAVGQESVRDVSSLSREQVQAELDQLARDLRKGRAVDGADPGSVFDAARRGPFLSDEQQAGTIGRKLAEI